MPALGDRMKAADPASRVVVVSGKDRSAMMLGGHRPDQRWWWHRGAFIGAPQFILIAACVVAFGPSLGFFYSWAATVASAASAV